MSFLQFAVHPEFSNRQTHFTKGVALEDFSFVGIMEKMENSLDILADKFPEMAGVDPVQKVNANENRLGENYFITKEQTEIIRAANSLDYELYGSALAKFTARNS